MQDGRQQSLSRRQAEIANLIVAGKSSREIAETLFLSPRTIEHHLKAIFNKLGVGSRVGLLARLIRTGDSVRNHLLESTRVYAAEKLALAGERDALAGRHLRYFRDWFVELRRDYEELQNGLESAFVTELDDVPVSLDGALVRRELTDGAALLAAISNTCWLG